MGRIASQNKILLIDDDQSLLKILTIQLKLADYIIETAQDGLAGFEKSLRNRYDIIVLDMGLPKLSGLEACIRMRSNGITAPILILSGNTNKKTIIDTLRAGADDYLVKPFDHNELQARIVALIRRNQLAFPAHVLKYNSLILNIQKHTVHLSNQELKLTKTEVALLRCLILHAPEVVPRNKLFEQIWGINHQHSSNRLDVYIKRVRQKLKQLDSTTIIKTIHGEGYCLN